MKIEVKVGLTKDTKLAMISQFLGFMLDAYDMALVPRYGSDTGENFFHSHRK